VSVLEIVLLIVALLLIVFFVGGYIANRRQYEAEDAELRRLAHEANERLALAHAEDNGWDRSTMEAAAREALAARGAPADGLELVQVIDRPGTDDDEAVFRAGAEEIHLGRRGGDWVVR
jgi:hypothetical protein